jgi:hypothetical protein
MWLLASSVRPSIHPVLPPSLPMEQVCSNLMDLHEILYMSIFRKSVEKFQVSLISDKIKATLHEDVCIFMIKSSSILLRMSNVSDKICRENQNSHFMYNNVFRKLCHFETMWKNMVEPISPQMTIRRMRIACWIPKAKSTHTQNM